jgi:hypothetical protein
MGLEGCRVLMVMEVSLTRCFGDAGGDGRGSGVMMEGVDDCGEDPQEGQTSEHSADETGGEGRLFEG